MGVYFGKYIKAFRENRKPRKLTSTELAAALNISQPTLSMYENDKLPTPLSVVISISRTYKDFHIAFDYNRVQNDEFVTSLKEVYGRRSMECSNKELPLAATLQPGVQLCGSNLLETWEVSAILAGVD